MAHELNYTPAGILHYNVQFKTGALANPVTDRAMCAIRPADIDVVWIVERKRQATPEEIRKLCNGAAKPSSRKEWEGDWR
ncbi:hypothetical protein P8935_24220 [Telmatobacter sp. DSM 110680]|uniref:Uncharacterized protein n=1 Tax=Telmatobacter sp. DSM 110680 TaxID=3036704 RepID=A0AAU7DKM7_9BACT